jgi:hypothetical protein
MSREDLIKKNLERAKVKPEQKLQRREDKIQQKEERRQLKVENQELPRMESRRQPKQDSRDLANLLLEKVAPTLISRPNSLEETLTRLTMPTPSSKNTWLRRCRVFLRIFLKFKCLQNLVRRFKI